MPDCVFGCLEDCGQDWHRNKLFEVNLTKKFVWDLLYVRFQFVHHTRYHRIFLSAAEVAVEVVQIEGPDHDPTKSHCLQPVDLSKPKSHMSDYFPNCYMHGYTVVLDWIVSNNYMTKLHR